MGRHRLILPIADAKERTRQIRAVKRIEEEITEEKTEKKAVQEKELR